MKKKASRSKKEADPKTSEKMLVRTETPTEQVTQKIRVLRRNREFSQEYMAVMLHISQNAYSRLENGRTPITVDRLCEICQVLEVKPADLLDMIDLQFPKVYNRSKF